MKKRVLLVNEARLESLALKDYLNKLNYDVEIAYEFDALYEVEHFDPNVVIVNYMDDKSLDEIINEIKSGKPDTKCLLSSNDSIKTNSCSNDNVDGVLHMPISMFKLKDALNRICTQ